VTGTLQLIPGTAEHVHGFSRMTQELKGHEEGIVSSHFWIRGIRPCIKSGRASFVAEWMIISTRLCNFTALPQFQDLFGCDGGR